MVYCVQAELAFSTAARRDTVLSNLQAFVGSRGRWQTEPEYLIAVPTTVGVNGISLEFRFTTRADADAVKARVESVASGVNAPLIGSTLRVHDCPHDVGAPCDPGTLRTW